MTESWPTKRNPNRIRLTQVYILQDEKQPRGRPATNDFQFTLLHQKVIRNHFKCTCRCISSELIDRDDLYQYSLISAYENEQKMQINVY